MRILENRGNWYKGNLHMHTTMSDGRLAPEDAVERYRKAGYDFVALTDHRAENPSWQERDFLVLTGAEYDTGDPGSSMPVYHILGIGMENNPNIRYRESYESRRPWPTAQEIVNAIRAAGGIAILAHPAWSVMTPEEMLGLHGFTAAEIYNTYCAVPWHPGRADSAHYFDIWGKNGKLVRAVAGDDAHRYQGEECRSFVMVNAPELSQEAVMEALRAGDFYASQGPKFYSIDFTDGEVTVEFSRDVETVVFLSNSPWGRKSVQQFSLEEQSILPVSGESNLKKHRALSATYQTGRQEKYVRIELISRSGAKAWSSPFPVYTGTAHLF